MIETIGALFSVLGSGAGGGIVGGLLGIFKQSQERKERVEMARINVERDQIDYQNAKEGRAHELAMLEKGGKIEVEKVASESDAAIELGRLSAIKSAHKSLNNLDTSTGVDNFRAMVRPSLAYWATTLFTVMLFWAFYEFVDTITAADGKEILIGMFATLTFIVTNIVTYYYVARRNPAPRL